jgi:heme/copper-type cytochrome/quinol oxidase subunit 2
LVQADEGGEVRHHVRGDLRHLCGIGHGTMGARLVVDTAESYSAWEQAHAVEVPVEESAEAPAEDATAAESTPAPATDH